MKRVLSAQPEPHVSNDNPFSEAQFKMLKYRPSFPERFGAIQNAHPSTIASRVPDSGLRDVACFRVVTSGRGLAAVSAVGRRCPGGASGTGELGLLELVLEGDADDLSPVVLLVDAEEDRGPGH